MRFRGILAIVMIVAFCGITAADDKKDGPKKAVSGTLTMGENTYKLESAVAFEMTYTNKKSTAVMFSEKTADLAKLKASLKKNGNDEDYFLTKPHVKLIFNEKGEFHQLVIYADGANVNSIGSDNVKVTATI